MSVAMEAILLLDMILCESLNQVPSQSSLTSRLDRYGEWQPEERSRKLDNLKGHLRVFGRNKLFRYVNFGKLGNR
jgi:hypothetical protein